MVCYHVDIHNEGREGLCSVCVCVCVRCVKVVVKGEDGEIVGDTIRDQFDRFEICDCENSSGYLEDPATWPLGSHVFRRRLMKVMSVPTEK